MPSLMGFCTLLWSDRNTGMNGLLLLRVTTGWDLCSFVEVLETVSGINR